MNTRQRTASQWLHETSRGLWWRRKFRKQWWWLLVRFPVKYREDD